MRFFKEKALFMGARVKGGPIVKGFGGGMLTHSSSFYETSSPSLRSDNKLRQKKELCKHDRIVHGACWCHN